MPILRFYLIVWSRQPCDPAPPFLSVLPDVSVTVDSAWLRDNAIEIIDTPGVGASIDEHQVSLVFCVLCLCACLCVFVCVFVCLCLCVCVFVLGKHVLFCCCGGRDACAAGWTLCERGCFCCR